VALWDQLVLRWCQYHITWPAWLLKPPVGACWCQKQHEMPPSHQSGMMGPIGAQMVPISHHMDRLVAETTCGCLLVPETALEATKVAWWDQLVLRWWQYHITWPAWLLKPPVGACWCLKQHEMPPKWHDGTNWFSDGANITSDGHLNSFPVMVSNMRPLPTPLSCVWPYLGQFLE
jgi:hypothetical protein